MKIISQMQFSHISSFLSLSFLFAMDPIPNMLKKKNKEQFNSEFLQ